MLDVFHKNKGEFHTLYRITIKELPFIVDNNITFIFRPLTINEFRCYNDILSRLPAFNYDIVYEDVLVNCLLEHDFIASKLDQDGFDYFSSQVNLESLFSDENKTMIFDLLPAGVFNSLAQLIVDVSYPQSVEEMNSRLEYARVSALSDHMSLVSSFLAGIFGYKPHEIDSMSWDKVAHLVALAELTVQAGPKMEIPLRFMTEEEIAKQTKKSDKIDFAKENKELAQFNGEHIDMKSLYESEQREIAELEEQRVANIRQLNKQYMQKFVR